MLLHSLYCQEKFLPGYTNLALFKGYFLKKKREEQNVKYIAHLKKVKCKQDLSVKMFLPSVFPVPCVALQK
jgi:hypothetical protein